ncbi:MAG: hypothetical protein BWK80_06645 [Desulfobacteraceae bacterium IS3]|nr:MAG: hypothetical protein BWK80_06645 [Desulfobacteraceae bacterium IS3]
MKIAAILCLSFIFFFSGVSLSFSSDITTLSDCISVKSVNALRVTASPWLLTVILTLENENKEMIGVRNGRLDMVINPENTPCGVFSEKTSSSKKMLANLGSDDSILPDTKLNLGKTEPISFEIEGCAEFDSKGRCKKPGQASVKIAIRLPAYAEEKNYIICKLFNYIGFPGSRKEISLRGSVEAGLLRKEGTNYGKVNLELYYKPPKIQSEVLFFGW